MNSWTELNDYIGQFNKKPGAYTPEEIKLIGEQHKKLPKSEKSWKNLSKILGYFGKPESLRKFCSSHKENTEIYSENFEEMYREKTKIRDIYNAYRASLRNEARIDSFKNSLTEAIQKLTPLTPVFTKPQIVTKAEAVLMLSDLHLGVKCDNFYNSYNSTIAQQRLQKLSEETIRYCKYFNIDTLHVLNLGDLIHGIIHTSARIEEELDLADQIVRAAQLIANFLATFQNSKLRVIYRSCTDNHSRALANKKESIEAENFNRVIDYIIEKSLIKFNNILFVHDNIDPTVGRFKLINGTNIMFAHGHLENVGKSIDAWINATKEFIDYFLIGHYHAGEEKPVGGGAKIIVNGSIVGTEQYAFDHRLFSPPEQKLLVFENGNLLNISINLK